MKIKLICLLVQISILLKNPDFPNNEYNFNLLIIIYFNNFEKF